MSSAKKPGRPARATRTSIAPARVAVGSYIDTVVLIQHRKLEDARFEALKKTFGPGRGVLGKDIIPDSSTNSTTKYTVHTLALHRPTIATAHFLDELLGHGQSIKSIHVALDILVDSLELALAWQDFFEGHLITNPKAPKRTFTVETSTYYNPFLKAGERYILYSDKPARLMENLMCCHLEARIIGPKALEAAGMASPSGILQLNHRKFWDERLDLRRHPSFEKIARASYKSSNSRKASALGDEVNQRRAMDLLRSSQNVRGKVVAQTLNRPGI